MRESVVPVDTPTTEALPTTGLFLLMTAVIGIAVCLASLSAADGQFAAISGLIAFLSFTISLVCFGLQSRQE